MSQSTAARIRGAARAHLASEKVIHSSAGRRLAALASGQRLPLSERDHLLFDVVTKYRVGDRQRWSAVLLEVMAPTITQRLQRFSPAGPALDVEDIAQELLLAVLEVALTLSLMDARYLERRLLLRAAERVSYRLERETDRQALLDPLSVLNGDEAEDGP
jgi:hypothetical protein